MNVLIACEESQVECCAFRAAGHIAFSCDLQECSGGHPEWHIHGDVLVLLSRDLTFITCDGVSHHIDQWDLIIAHPPCTFLSKAGSTRLYSAPGCLDYQRYLKGLEGKAFFESFLFTDCCSHIAVENPVPLSVFDLPPYQQIVQPWEYCLDGSEPFLKTTCLWLIGLPLLVPLHTAPPCNLVSWVSGSSNKRTGRIGLHSSAKMRSKSFRGIAHAMVSQWSDFGTFDFNLFWGC